LKDPFKDKDRPKADDKKAAKAADTAASSVKK
jgi:hypothetical protein